MKIKEQYAIAILIGVSFLFLFLFYLFIQDNRKLSIPEKIIKEGVLYTENILAKPFDFIYHKIEDYKEMKELYHNLKEKQKKIASYDQMESSLKEEKSRVKELEELLELKNNLGEYEEIAATVLNRNSESWYDTFTIDKGTDDQIEEGMAVVTKYGLIGKIIKTTPHTSTVKLITSVNETFQISVKIEIDENYLYGLLTNYKDGYFMISGISDNREIPKYSKVTTTGLDNRFPSGILIGYVESEQKDNFDLARTIYISPAHSVSDIRYVAVLKRRET